MIHAARRSHDVENLVNHWHEVSAFLAGAVAVGAILFAEVLMHLVLFNVRQRSLYNPGMVTGVVLMGLIGLYYFTSVFDASVLVWWDWVLAVVWFVAVFVFCFRSPLYWKLGDVPGYPLEEQTAFGLVR